MNESYVKIKECPNEELPKLLKLKEKYKNVPTIYNHIAIAYGYSKQEEQHFNALMETINRFPDYLFGKIALAEYYLNRDEHKKVPEVLNHRFEIHMHFHPSVKLFHVSEVRSFHSIVGRYYLRANKINRALYYFLILNDIDPSHVATKQLADEIMRHEIGELQNKFQQRREC
ncbi:MAG: hypothetical protein HQM12_12450 [SAR324 cluster bacterium]|nr:hypothetical protein [SAR324 cluster bacterium]